MSRVFRLAIGTVHVNFDGYVPPDPKIASRVIDGDTFDIGGQRWRLFGWDAPPMELGTSISRNDGNKAHCVKEQFLGIAAKAKAERLLAEGAARGALHVDVLNLKTEKFRRQLVTIKIDGVDLGQLLADEGLSTAYHSKGPKRPFCTCEERWAHYHRKVEEMRAAKAEKRPRRTYLLGPQPSQRQ